MKKLYNFFWDCGRAGDLKGLFIADEEEINKLIGKEIYFGEVLGKHSEIFGILERDEVEVKSDDQEFISKLIDVLGDGTISGFNPLDYYEED